jgi:hypothetical protein
MRRAKSLWDFCPTRMLRAAALLAALLAAGQSEALAQTQGSAAEEIALSELLSLPGTIIGQGRNTKAVGPHKVASYRVEHLALPRPVTVEIGGKKSETAEAFRLTIVGGPFPVRALPPVIWVDDVAIGYGVESEDLKAITVVTFDRSLLREGASIYLSYGDKENKEDRTELPEKLSLDGPKGGTQ